MGKCYILANVVINSTMYNNSDMDISWHTYLRLQEVYRIIMIQAETLWLKLLDQAFCARFHSVPSI